MNFSTDFNPLDTPESVRKLFTELAPSLSTPASPKNLDLCREIARYFPVWEENVIAERSFASLLSILLQALEPKRVLIFEPCSPEYRRILNQHRIEILSQPLIEQEDFGYKLPKILNGLHGADMVILGHPNDPVGALLHKDELTELLEDAKRRNVFVLIDESFSVSLPDRSAAQLIKDNSYFLVTRSLANLFSLPGIGAQYGIAPRKLVQKLHLRQEAMPVGRIVELMNIEAVRDRLYQEAAENWIAAERDFVRGRLERIEGLKIYPGEALFLLVRLRGRLQAGHLLSDLSKVDMVLRSCEMYSGLDTSYFRLSLRTRQENAALLEKVDAWMKERLPELRIPMNETKPPVRFQS